MKYDYFSRPSGQYCSDTAFFILFKWIYENRRAFFMEQLRQFVSAVLAGFMIGMGGTVFLFQENKALGLE